MFFALTTISSDSESFDLLGSNLDINNNYFLIDKRVHKLKVNSLVLARAPVLLQFHIGNLHHRCFSYILELLHYYS